MISIVSYHSYKTKYYVMETCFIFRIEYIGKWCKHLKILYLQNNLIPRIGMYKLLGSFCVSTDYLGVKKHVSHIMFQPRLNSLRFYSF